MPQHELEYNARIFAADSGALVFAGDLREPIPQKLTEGEFVVLSEHATRRWVEEGHDPDQPIDLDYLQRHAIGTIFAGKYSVHPDRQERYMADEA